MINVNGHNDRQIFNGQAQGGVNADVSGNVHVSAVRPGGSVTSSDASKLVTDIRNLMTGDAFSGEVASLDNGVVTIKLADGSQLNASLQNQVNNLTPGQNLTFVVTQNNGNTVLLKPMAQDMQSSYIAAKALEAAGLADIPANEEMVHELLNQNMSISAQTLNDMAKLAAKYPDAGTDTLVRLNKLGIPVTQENIQQFEAYKSYESSISDDISSLGSGIADRLSQIAAGQGAGEAAQLMQTVTDILYGQNTDGNVHVVNTDSDTAQNVQSGEARTEALPAGAAKAQENTGVGALVSAETRNALAGMIEDTFGSIPQNLAQGLADSQLTAQEFMNTLSSMMSSSDVDTEKLSKLLSSDGYKEMFGMVMRDTMRLSPSDVQKKDAISEFYEKVRNNAGKLADALGEKAQEKQDSQLSKALNNIRNNVEFMNDLNRNMTYFQMPIKFSENNANGELYVFTNKKKLAKKGDDVSALLHLDMEHLGPMDIYVKLKGKNVSTNFCLESEEMLDFVYAHIDQLNDRLEKLGLNCHFDMKVREPEEQFDFVQDFVDADVPKMAPTTPFVFDRKA
ncbi:MAG: flagellar hook-length control protein FliK [[Bacteroides] pectinophilus]|nr:flagellar hook-length control protein FliK [[Bacteroides] pectinophilus]